jgi:hypothetical protein
VGRSLKREFSAAWRARVRTLRDAQREADGFAQVLLGRFPLPSCFLQHGEFVERGGADIVVAFAP